MRYNRQYISLRLFSFEVIRVTKGYVTICVFSITFRVVVKTTQYDQIRLLSRKFSLVTFGKYIQTVKNVTYQIIYKCINYLDKYK